MTLSKRNNDWKPYNYLYQIGILDIMLLCKLFVIRIVNFPAHANKDTPIIDKHKHIGDSNKLSMSTLDPTPLLVIGV